MNDVKIQNKLVQFQSCLCVRGLVQTLNLQTEEQALKTSLIWACFGLDVVLLEWKLLQTELQQ